MLNAKAIIKLYNYFSLSGVMQNTRNSHITYSISTAAPSTCLPFYFVNGNTGALLVAGALKQAPDVCSVSVIIALSHFLWKLLLLLCVCIYIRISQIAVNTHRKCMHFIIEVHRYLIKQYTSLNYLPFIHTCMHLINSSTHIFMSSFYTQIFFTHGLNKPKTSLSQVLLYIHLCISLSYRDICSMLLRSIYI